MKRLLGVSTHTSRDLNENTIYNTTRIAGIYKKKNQQTHHVNLVVVAIVRWTSLAIAITDPTTFFARNSPRILRIFCSKIDVAAEMLLAFAEYPLSVVFFKYIYFYFHSVGFCAFAWCRPLNRIRRQRWWVDATTETGAVVNGRSMRWVAVNSWSGIVCGRLGVYTVYTILYACRGRPFERTSFVWGWRWAVGTIAMVGTQCGLDAVWTQAGKKFSKGYVALAVHMADVFPALRWEKGATTISVIGAVHIGTGVFAK